MSKRKILVIGATERLRKRVISLLSDLPGVSVSSRNDCDDIEAFFSDHRFDAVLLEDGPNFDHAVVLIHHITPSLPVLIFGDNPDHAQTRMAFLSGATDMLKIRSSTSEEISSILERAFNPIDRDSDAERQFQIRCIRNISHRGQSFMQQMMAGTPPAFYMNGNRATLLRANVLCTRPTSPLWQQEVVWEWIQEFGVGNSFLFDGNCNELHLAAIIEQDYINNASFLRMLSTRLERCYNHMSELDCVCVATHCSSDYLSMSVLHRLDSIVSLVFYMDESQTILDSASRPTTVIPAQFYNEFCTAVAVRDVSTAIACVDRAVLKLRNDLPSPAFARNKLNRFLWELAAVLGSRGDRAIPLHVDDSRIGAMRDSIVKIIRTMVAEEASAQPVSPLDELILRIESNPGMPINIDQAAEEINFSRSHFCRLFRQHTGMSFTAFLTQKRIEMACSLLKKTGMSIDEISDIVGISNTWYFKKLFQKEIGSTVEEWIAQNRESDASLSPASE